MSELYKRKNAATEKAKIVERRKVVAANIKAGVSQRQLAETLNVATSTISKDVKAILAEWRKEALENTADHVLLEMQRTDAIINGIYDKAKAGNLGAIDRLLKVIDLRGKMLGLFEGEGRGARSHPLPWSDDERDPLDYDLEGTPPKKESEE